MIERDRVKLFARVWLLNLIKHMRHSSFSHETWEQLNMCWRTHIREHGDTHTHVLHLKSWNFCSKLPKISQKHHCCGIEHLLAAYLMVWPSLLYGVPSSWQKCCLCSRGFSFVKEVCLCFCLKYKYDHNYKHKHTTVLWHAICVGGLGA